MRPFLLLVCVVAAGCSSPSAAPVGHGKPAAAVDVRLDAVALGDGDYDVTLTATPTTTTDALELALDGRKVAAGAVAAGESRTMTTRVHVDRGREILGAAAVGQGNRRRNRAVSTWVGTPIVTPARPVQVVTLPDGNEVAEVRP